MNPVSKGEAPDSGSESEGCEGDEIEVDSQAPTFGSMRMVDGQFVIETSNFEETISDYLSRLDAEKGEESGSSEDSDEPTDQ